MIRKLRQRHRRIIAVLGILLPLLLIVGIVLRRAVPQSETLLSDSSPPTTTFTATGYERDDLFERSPVRVRLYRDHGSGALAVGLVATKDFLKPDLLAYWSVTRPASNDRLPPDARLLGAFVSTMLVLPPEATNTDGQLTLFSLANRKIVDVSKPTRFRDQTK